MRKMIYHILAKVILLQLSLSLVVMGIINYTVYCLTTRKTIVSWRISAVGQPSFTFQHFFDDVIKAQCPSTSASSPSLLDVFVGKSKEALDPVDKELMITEVVSVWTLCEVCCWATR